MTPAPPRELLDPAHCRTMVVLARSVARLSASCVGNSTMAHHIFLSSKFHLQQNQIAGCVVRVPAGRYEGTGVRPAGLLARGARAVRETIPNHQFGSPMTGAGRERAWLRREDGGCSWFEYYGGRRHRRRKSTGKIATSRQICRASIGSTVSASVLPIWRASLVLTKQTLGSHTFCNATSGRRSGGCGAATARRPMRLAS